MKNNHSLPKLLFCLFLLVNSTAFAQQKKPNIIFILTDDQRWDALGYAGNDIIQTPEMDKLATEGVYFKNAFVTTPICAASRASILTGLYERTHGYTFGQTLNDSYASESYPLQMKKAGYHTGFFGKFGIKYPGFKSLFDEADDYDRDVKYADRRGYFYKTINGDSTHLTEYTAYQAQEFIKNAPEDQPFLLSLAFSAPHAHDPAKDQFFWTEAVDGLYQNVKIPGPVLGQKKYFDAQPDYVQNSESRTRWFWRYDTPDHYQQSMKGYYRMISEVDIQIGKIRALLEEKGLAENTVIIFMGDNGYFYGERQLAGKWLMYDNSLRVPMIIYDPRNPLHRDVADFALNIDIAPTILEFAGVSAPALWQGKSLASYVKGEDPAASRQEFIAEHLWKVNIIPASEGLRTPEWKYFRYQADLVHEELYNLKKDPLEKKNLAGKKKYADVLSEMRFRFEEKVAKLVGDKVD
ncbi:arylsulfatase A-like enzyme [Algoriphagus ratkowskyi]|uniref:Sulfatase n=1 Tax=Algoriphagus ratkowskyi TaxID=57028 RepID=A0A2W7R9Q8_9BACT|nr:sulfatase [Algoriphagus ratkowskyi]PZX55876.1 arylsulfatase A-like enzyme [Algoriphagus ratkowskyi]TXD77303.1 sulfatase [Algoriphagus ratkowskyi]